MSGDLYTFLITEFSVAAKTGHLNVLEQKRLTGGDCNLESPSVTPQVKPLAS